MANKSKKSLDINGLEYVASKVMTLVNSGGTADYLVEEGTEGIWTYRKYASGIAECWGDSYQTVDTNNPWGNIWLGNLNNVYLPSGLFTSILSVQGNVNSPNGMWATIQIVTYPSVVGGYVYHAQNKTGLTGDIFISVKGLWKEFTPSIMNTPSLDLYYPVGSIYQTSNANFDPNVTFGGTWELITNKFLIGAGDEYELGETGGSTEHTHKYGVMYHTYFYTVQMESGQGGVLTMENGSETTLGTETTVTTTDTVATNNANAASGKNVTAYAKSSIGYTGKESTIPPYKAVYMWERTA